MFTLAFDRKDNLLMIRASGIYSSDDVVALDAAMLQVVAREGPLRAILDFTAVETVAVSDNRLAVRGRQPTMLPSGSRVFVAPQPEIHHLCRTFAEHQRFAGSAEPKVVSTLAEAYAAFGVDDPAFEPVEGS